MYDKKKCQKNTRGSSTGQNIFQRVLLHFVGSHATAGLSYANLRRCGRNIVGRRGLDATATDTTNVLPFTGANPQFGNYDSKPRCLPRARSNILRFPAQQRVEPPRTSVARRVVPSVLTPALRRANLREANFHQGTSPAIQLRRMLVGQQIADSEAVDYLQRLAIPTISSHM